MTASSLPAEAPTVADYPMPPTPRLVRGLFQPRTKPPSRLNKTLNKAVVKANVAVFRRSGGRLGGGMMGMDALVLTTLGRRTGRLRTNVLLYIWDRGRFVVCAAYGGEMVDPAWYHNLRSLSRATIEIGPERLEVTSQTLAPGAERDELFGRLVAAAPNYGRYQAMTTRLLPVVVLTPVSS